MTLVMLFDAKISFGLYISNDVMVHIQNDIMFALFSHSYDYQYFDYDYDCIHA